MEKMIETRQEVLDFLRVDEHSNSQGYGSGDGFGYSSGNGLYDGSGDGSGHGAGDGYDNGSGYGSGYGSGDGYGSGYGDGSGSGFGTGISQYHSSFGSGSGSSGGCGYGSGPGYGKDIEAINGMAVHNIDDVSTLIDSVHGNFAKGRILNNDLTIEYCFIAKFGNYFAHGDTLEDAFRDAREKYDENSPLEERIARFNEQYPDRDKKVPAKGLFDWHHVLTGSCLAGRKCFCKEHGLDYENGEYTVNEFISLTMNAYNGSVIRQLEESKP